VNKLYVGIAISATALVGASSFALVSDHPKAIPASKPVTIQATPSPSVTPSPTPSPEASVKPSPKPVVHTSIKPKPTPVPVGDTGNQKGTADGWTESNTAHVPDGDTINKPPYWTPYNPNCYADCFSDLTAEKQDYGIAPYNGSFETDGQFKGLIGTPDQNHYACEYFHVIGYSPAFKFCN
jgi:hypothetical protein